MAWGLRRRQVVSVMALVWLPGKTEVSLQRQGAQVGRLRSNPKSRICEARVPRATGFDYRFNNDAVRFIVP